MRRLEEHLSSDELASLLKSLQALDCGGPDERQLAEHLRQCEDCRELADMHWQLKGSESGATHVPETPCPEPSLLLQWAEGSIPEKTSELVAHLARCEECSVLFREAMDLNQEPQLDLDASKLESASPEWQLRVARQMSSLQNKPPVLSISKSVPRSRLWVWATISAAAVILISAYFGGVAIWRNLHPTNDRLLALAYNKQRTTDLRIPGGDPVPISSGTRGPAGPAAPTELLELQLRARQHLDLTPNDPYWHQIQGEISVLQGDGLTARRDFEIAETTNDQLPNLHSDLAAAWFEIGEKNGSSESYGEAAELLGRAIQQDPQNSLLYYNRALCWLRLGLRENALKDFEAALSYEHSSAWRQTIQTEIAKLSSRSGKSSETFRVETSEKNYESSLAVAVQLLSHWTESNQDHDMLLRISALGIQHRDLWLHDWIAATHSSESNKADSFLSAAVRLGTAGSGNDSLTNAERALSIYRGAANVPGKLRAELAIVYALQRLDRAHDCLKAAAGLDHDLGEKQYSWIRTQLALEEADCYGISGDFEQAERSFARTLAISDSAGLNQLHLRAMGSQALLLDLVGKPMASWQLNTEGIRLCAQVDCPPIRYYQLLYNTAFGADELGLSTVAAEVMSSAVPIAAQTGDTTTHAYALETLAAMEGRSGRFDASSKDFEQADRVIQSAGHSPLPVLYRAEWDTDRAEILLRQQNKTAALNVLQQNEIGMKRSDYQAGQLLYLDQLAAIQLAMHDTSPALSTAWQAVNLAEQSLPTLKGVVARERWEHENASAYAQLVKAYLQSGDSNGALEAWERFRRVPYGKVREDAGRLTLGPRANKPMPKPPDTRVIVIARVEDFYILWLAATQPLRVLRTVTVADGKQLRKLAVTLYHLCSDGDSSLIDVQSVGLHVYQGLLAPFADDLRSQSVIRFDIDPSLDVLPLSAITTPTGDWLGTSRQVAVIPPWWTVQPERMFSAPRVDISGKVLVIDGFNKKSRETVQPDNSESSEIASSFARAQLLDGDSESLSSLKRNLESANILHFSGHATAESESHFVLAWHDDSPAKTISAEAIDSLQMTRCQLAVLAACNTSAISPHRIAEIPDLRDAMLRSGAQTVIASSWDVDDHSTRALMLAFYRGIIQGESPERSLQAAKALIQENPTWRHPFYWASFETFTN